MDDRQAAPVQYDPVGYEDFNGVRYLQFGTEWVQGAMRLSRPDWIELEYVRQMMSWMILRPAPSRISILGLGAGSLARFCRRSFPQAWVEVVELNPAVIEVCKVAFCLPARGDLFEVSQRDALDWALEDGPKSDVVLIDLYDAQAKGPVLDTAQFYAGVSARLAPGGLASVNLFGEHPSYAKNVKAMREGFARVGCLPAVDAGNVVALGFNDDFGVDWSSVDSLRALDQAAAKIHGQMGMSTAHWPDALAHALRR